MTRHAIPFSIALALSLGLSAGSAVAQRHRPSFRHARRHPTTAATVPPTNPPAPLSDATAAAAAPTPEAIEVARAAFRDAVTHFEHREWDAARAGFYTALRLHPSPLVRFNLALACRNGNHLVDALQHYREFLRETALDPTMAERRAAAEREVTYILAHVAWLEVDITGDTPAHFDLDGGEQPLGLLGHEIPVEPGDHTLRVEGVALNIQEHHGSFYEGEHVRVPVTLSRERPATVAAGAAWSSQPLPMAHWTLEPGPQGRWIDWSTLDITAPPSLWNDHPITVALLLGGSLFTGSPGIAGTAGVSVRYFPRAWFGLEAMAGGDSVYGPEGGLYALLRFPLPAPSTYAPGLRVGASANASALQVTCSSCNGGLPPSVNSTVTAIWLDMAFTSEWRLRPRLPLRLVVGARILANGATFRSAADHAVYDSCTAGGACDLYLQDPANAPTTVVPYVTLDLGYAL